MKASDFLSEANYGRYYCSTDKKWKTRQGPKQTRKTESVEQGVAESEYGIPDETLGRLPDGPKMTFGEFKKMWPGVILKRPSGGSLAGSVVADVEGWMNNPKSVWEPLKSMAEGERKPQPYNDPDWMKKIPKKELDGLAGRNKKKEQGVEEEKQRLDPKCWTGYKKQGTKMKGGVRVNNCVKISESEYTLEGEVSMWYDDQLNEAEYQGRKVPLGKPMQGDVKKFKVYVKNEKGNVIKVNFGDPNMRIKKSNPERRKSFRARHNCDNPGPRTKARYWSCRKW